MCLNFSNSLSTPSLWCSLQSLALRWLEFAVHVKKGSKKQAPDISGCLLQRQPTLAKAAAG